MPHSNVSTANAPTAVADALLKQSGMRHYQLSGVLTTMSPLNIAQPGSAYVDIDGNFGAKLPDTFPCIRMRKEWFPENGLPRGGLAVPADEAEAIPEGSESKQKRIGVPMIPPNSWRGWTRRALAQVVYDGLIAKGETLSVNAYNVMQCGAATGRPDGEPAGLNETMAARHNPFFGLVGGGPRMLHGSLRTDSSYAITSKTLAFMPYVPETYKIDGTLTTVAFKRRNDDILGFADPAYQQQIIADYGNAVNAYQDEQANHKKAAGEKRAKDAEAAKAKKTGKPQDKTGDEANDDKTERGLRSFTAIENVMPGVHFGIRFECDGNDTHLGLLLQAIMKMLEKQRLGGLGNIGYGRFALPEFKLRIDGGTPIDVFKRLDRPTIAESYSFNDDAPEIVAALDAWADYASIMTAENFEEFSKPMDKGADKSKTAAA